MRTESQQFQTPNDDEIAVYAYHLWESEGRLSGRELDYWLQAKAHLMANREYEAGLLQAGRAKVTGSARKDPALLSNGSTSKSSRKRATRTAGDSVYA